MRYFTACLLLSLLFLLVLAIPGAAVQAQDVEVTPEVIEALTPTAGGGWFELTPEQYTLLSEDALEGILFILKAMVALFGTALAGLFFSAPPWLKPFLVSGWKTARTRFIEPVGAIVEATEGKSDDAQYDEFIRRLDKLEERIGFREPSVMPSTASFTIVDGSGSERRVYYEGGIALLHNTSGRFEEHPDGTLTWHPDDPNARG
jgi:hypothetical protein